MKLEIGAIIKDLRRKQKYTQEQLTAFFGVSADVLPGINKTERKQKKIYTGSPLYKNKKAISKEIAFSYMTKIRSFL
jgi:transcriptional regulator with XRE-family HTH domain